MHLGHVKSNPSDAVLAEFDQLLTYLRQIEKLRPDGGGVTLFLGAGLFGQFIIVAKAAFLQKAIDRFAAMAAKVLLIETQMILFTGITTVVTPDL
jgi:hypothetical protein